MNVDYTLFTTLNQIPHSRFGNGKLRPAPHIHTVSTELCKQHKKNPPRSDYAYVCGKDSRHAIECLYHGKQGDLEDFKTASKTSHLSS